MPPEKSVIAAQVTRTWTSLTARNYSYFRRTRRQDLTAFHLRVFIKEEGKLESDILLELRILYL